MSNTNKPALEDFISQIEEVFSQPLTESASDVAEDFWNHWEKFVIGISNNAVVANVDALRLGMNFPQYKRYHTWKGLGKALIFGAIILVWFWWPGSIAILTLGIASHIYGSYISAKDIRQFSEELIDSAKTSSSDHGFAKLCAHYIAGTIQLSSEAGSAHWPQYPSNALSGKQSFVST